MGLEVWKPRVMDTLIAIAYTRSRNILYLDILYWVVREKSMERDLFFLELMQFALKWNSPALTSVILGASFSLSVIAVSELSLFNFWTKTESEGNIKYLWCNNFSFNLAIKLPSTCKPSVMQSSCTLTSAFNSLETELMLYPGPSVKEYHHLLFEIPSIKAKYKSSIIALIF